jgi:hypothetical protein
MEKKETGTENEMMVYRILSDGKRVGIEILLRDHFTQTLLAMVLATNAILLLIPVSLEYLPRGTAVKTCTIMILTLLPGYAALITLLFARMKKPSHNAMQELDRGHLRVSQAPFLRNAMTGIQCILFASLLCSTFFVRQQLSALKSGSPMKFTCETSLQSVVFSPQSSVGSLP